MFLTISSALVLAISLIAAGCGQGAPEASFVSEAMASPAHTPDYGWRTNSAAGVADGTVTEYY